ncbi:hypothetical protein Maq22A_c09655 [Methylobacterium aquaticum]|uniref:Uncharacterized protein n=1 Tax=Methylobacterium aquaticum TaxID=270351 RepID=A0A0C6F9Y1_9HYPH|nr:hypothetical protein Maq22A_c09655 [Methylobacterium aquaticum]
MAARAKPANSVRFISVLLWIDGNVGLSGPFGRKTGVWGPRIVVPGRRGASRIYGGAPRAGRGAPAPGAFPDEVETGSSKKMRQNKDLESIPIAARS